MCTPSPTPLLPRYATPWPSCSWGRWWGGGREGGFTGAAGCGRAAGGLLAARVGRAPRPPPSPPTHTHTQPPTHLVPLIDGLHARVTLDHLIGVVACSGGCGVGVQGSRVRVQAAGGIRAGMAARRRGLGRGGSGRAPAWCVIISTDLHGREGEVGEQGLVTTQSGVSRSAPASAGSRCRQLTQCRRWRPPG